MPLWLAVIFGLLGSMGATLALAGISDNERVQDVLYFMVVVTPAFGVPVLARYKRRSLLRWATFALIAVLMRVGFGMTFLPLTLVLALAFAIRPAIKIPEADLEAQEDPRPLKTLLGVREDVGRLHSHVEESYLARDYRGIADQRENLEAIDPRIARVPEQISERGGRVRLHMRAGVMQLLGITDAAEYVATTIREDPSLDHITQGDETTIKSKSEKALHKQVREIEILLDRSRIEMVVAKGLLEELGYTAPKEVARPWMPPQAILPVPDPPVSGSPATRPSPAKRRPQRPPRRSRF
jgi:hypothetical protein